MRITLVISSLSSGGAERVLSLMAGYWAEKGHHVTLLTLAGVKSDFYPVHEGVIRVGLGLTREAKTPLGFLLNNFERVRQLRRAIGQSAPEIVVSFVDRMNVVTLLATLGLGIPVVVSERIDPRHHPIGAVWNLLRRMLYPRAAAVVVQTEAVAEWAQSFLNPQLVRVIPNPVRPVGATARISHGRTIVAMGRLVHQKGFDILLRAFARCHHRFPTWELIIIGEGDDRRSLESLARELRLTDAVSMVGRSNNPDHLLARADVFVMPSRYEGFPNALLEAMAIGLPVIAADCPSGPKEIIRHGENGLLVPPEDVDALASALDLLMGDEQRRATLSSRALEVRDRYSIDSVMDKWDAVLRSNLNGVSRP